MGRLWDCFSPLLFCFLYVDIRSILITLSWHSSSWLSFLCICKKVTVSIFCYLMPINCNAVLFTKKIVMRAGEINKLLIMNDLKFSGSTAVRYTWHYITVELPDFHTKIENQVILDMTRMCVNPCDRFWLEHFPNNSWNIQFFQLCYATNIFIAAKFVIIIFSCFYKHRTWLHWISLFLFEFLTT